MRSTREGNLVVAALAAAVFVGGCTQPHVIGGEIDPSDVTTPGVRYHLGRDVVVVDVTVTRVLVEKPSDRKAAPDGKAPPATFDEIGRSAVGVVSVETIPDFSTTYFVNVEPGGTMDHTLDVKVVPSGTPSSIGTTSADRSAEILGNVLEFAARVAGAAIGVRGLEGTDDEKDQTIHRETRTLRFVFPIEELPASSDLPHCSASMKAMFDACGIAVSADPMACVPRPHSTCGLAHEPFEVFYRPTRPFTITVWTYGAQWIPEKKAEAAATRTQTFGPVPSPNTIQSQGVFNLLHPATPAYRLTSEEKAFSTQSLAVGFDAAGRFISFTRSGTSPVAGFAAGLNASSKSAATGLDAGFRMQKSALEQEKEILTLKKEIEDLKAGVPPK